MAAAPRLSVCMIVKNEAHQLSEILSQCQFADEIIVVDTGSTDNTKRITSGYTDKVFDFEWCDDFSAARNYSLKQATGDYALIIDADDRLTPENQERIAKLREHMDGEQVFNFALHNIDSDGNRMSEPYYQPRCLPLRKNLFYEGRAHNQVAPSIERAGLKVCLVNIDINHIGYADPTIHQPKRDRTARILHLEYKENPTDGRVNMYLGLHYERARDFKTAEKHFEAGVTAFEPKTARKPYGLYESYAGLVRVNSELGEKDRAQDYFKKLCIFTHGAPKQVALGVTALAEQYRFYDEHTALIDNEPIPELDVVLVGNNDWANLGYEFSQALRTVGVKAEMLIGHFHTFGYPKQGKLILTPSKVGKYFEKAKIIQFMHSQYPETRVDLKGKRLFVFHGGTVYRKYSDRINEFFNPMVEGTIIQTTDLMGLGAKNEHWVLPCIDLGLYKPDFGRKDPKKLIIGHFHWNEAKRSDLLDAAVQKLESDAEVAGKFEYRKETRRVSWQENIERMSACDVVADQFDKVWGMTSLEAAALGKIVITTFDGIEAYEREYGPCGLVKVEADAEHIAKMLKTLIKLPNSGLFSLKMSSRNWVKKYHNYRFIGEKLKKVYGL